MVLVLFDEIDTYLKLDLGLLLKKRKFLMMIMDNGDNVMIIRTL